MDLFPFFFVAYRQQGPCPVDPVIYLLNMDTQDAQDNQDGRLLRERPAPAMIACGFADVQHCQPAVCRKILYILSIHVNYAVKSGVD